jgi:hypothetical protein
LLASANHICEFLDLSKRMYKHRFAYHNLVHHAW